MYPIKAVSTITGLNTETLRAWERRYQAILPHRDEKGRRLYSESDIERLQLLNSATIKGHAISKVAPLENKALQDLLAEANHVTLTNNDVFFKQIITALKKYDIKLCEDLLRRGLLAMSPLQYARDLLIPTLEMVGQLWHQERLTIAQEHMFSNCVKRIALSMVHNMMSSSDAKARIIFTTLSGEQHEFGILLSSMIAAEKGYTCYYLGPDLPYSELSNIARQLHAGLIITNLINDPPKARTVEQLRIMAQDKSLKPAVWLGGAGRSFINKMNFANPPRIIENFDQLDALLNLPEIAAEQQ